MPVKFRCSACGQLLGIARRKIGQTISCPRCHHPLTVPTEDQTDRPPPAPGAPLLEDKEFDKWIGKANAPPKGAGRQGASGLTESEPASPDDVDYDLDDDEEDSVHVIADLGRRPQHGGGPNPTVLAALAVCLLLTTFILGILVGRYVLPVERTSAPTVRAPEPPPPPAALPAEEAPVPAEQPAPQLKLSVTGSMFFQTADGPKPDEGACVLVIPSAVKLPAKIDAVGLRPEDQFMQHRPGLSRLREFGGELGYVDADGKFDVPVGEKGTYYVLILSKNTRRRSTAVDIQDRAILQQYFAEFNRLLTDRDHLLISRKVESEQTDPIEYTFGR